VKFNPSVNWLSCVHIIPGNPVIATYNKANEEVLAMLCAECAHAEGRFTFWLYLLQTELPREVLNSMTFIAIAQELQALFPQIPRVLESFFDLDQKFQQTAFSTRQILELEMLAWKDDLSLREGGPSVWQQDWH